MHHNDTPLPAVISGRRACDHYKGVERRSMSRSLNMVHHNAGLLAQVIATHLGVAQTRQARRELPQRVNQIYAASNHAPITTQRTVSVSI